MFTYIHQPCVNQKHCGKYLLNTCEIHVKMVKLCTTSVNNFAFSLHTVSDYAVIDPVHVLPNLNDISVPLLIVAYSFPRLPTEMVFAFWFVNSSLPSFHSCGRVGR